MDSHPVTLAYDVTERRETRFPSSGGPIWRTVIVLFRALPAPVVLLTSYIEKDLLPDVPRLIVVGWHDASGDNNKITILLLDFKPPQPQ